MRGLRRHPVVWSAVIAISAIAISGVAISPSFSASFLTKKAAKKLFYTKKKSDARYYTKGQLDARFGAPDADAGGAIRISASPAEWRKTNPTFTGQLNNQSTGTSVSYGGTATSEFFQLGASLPTVLHGTPLRLTGMTACYNTTVSVTDTTLSNVRIYRFDPEANHTDQLFEDQTNQTDDACRSYTLPSPVQLQGTDVVYAEYFVDFPGGGGQGFIAGAVTFNMTP